MPDKRNLASEAYSEISQHYKLISLKEQANRLRQCYAKISELNGFSMECWCRRAGPDGKDLPCPPQ